MTTITSLPTVSDDLRELAEFLKDHLGPAEVVINMKVRGTTQADKVHHLEQIAAEWGVRVGVDGDGKRIAEVRFGRVRLEAHVCPQGETHAECLTRLTAVKALAS